MKKRLLAMLLSVVMLFTLTAPAFAASLPQEQTSTIFSASSADIDTIEVDFKEAAVNIYENLTPAQQKEFLALIEILAYQGDTRLVEFHKAYVDPSYELSTDGIIAPQTVATSEAIDIAGQLQALNLPSAVYYGLLSLAAALGLPVGNLIDVIVALGLGAIIIAYWDDISDVWQEIIDIFVDAFGSMVMEGFYYLQGLVGVYTISVSGNVIAINGEEYKCDTEAGEAVITMDRNGDKYYPAMIYRNYVMVAPVNISRKVAVAILKENDSTVGVFSATGNLARDLCESLGGAIGPESHWSPPKYLYHYHGNNYTHSHSLYI